MQSSPQIARSFRAGNRMLAVALALVLAGCATGGGGVEEAAVYQTADGAVLVDTYTVVATVTGIDAGRHAVTLTDPNGKSHTYKVARDFDLGRLAVNQQIGVQLTEEVAYAVRKGGEPAAPAREVLLAAADSAQAGAVFASDAVEVTVAIVAVDPSSRKVTYRTADGTVKTTKVHKGVDLGQVAPGDTVTLGYAEQVIVATAKP